MSFFVSNPLPDHQKRQEAFLIERLHLLSNGIPDEIAEPTIESPTSQLATEGQFYGDTYKDWCSKIHERARFHRKQWEFVYILQSLQVHNKLHAGSKGLGFGVGTEPLPALMASMGCQIHATDMDASEAQKKGWSDTNQHAESLSILNNKDICDQEIFNKNVTFEVVDMNHIPDSLKDFDFTWSACCLEHLGSLQAGFDFIENSLQCLKPGGVAVHTTEFNLSSNEETIESGETVLYRKKDFQTFIEYLLKQGYEVSPMNFHPGSRVLDYYLDIPPYTSDTHIRLLLDQYITTSVGLIITKK